MRPQGTAQASATPSIAGAARTSARRSAVRPTAAHPRERLKGFPVGSFISLYGGSPLPPSVRTAVTLLAVLLVAGCVAPDAADDDASVPESRSEIRVGGALLHAGGSAGGLALVHLAEGGPAELTFPADVLVLDSEKR